MTVKDYVNEIVNNTEDPLWFNSEETLLLALCSYLKETGEDYTNKEDLKELLNGVSTGKTDSLIEELEEKKKESEAVKYYKSFNNVSERQKLSIIASLILKI